jgi:hypothetical protein
MLRWRTLCKPLEERGLLVQCEEGPHFWHAEGGATARRGRLWYILGRNAESGRIDCKVAPASRLEDLSPLWEDYTMLESLLIEKRVSSTPELDAAFASGDANAQVEAFARLIAEHLPGTEEDVALCRADIEMYKDLAPHVERMFRTK